MRSKAGSVHLIFRSRQTEQSPLGESLATQGCRDIQLCGERAGPGVWVCLWQVTREIPLGPWSQPPVSTGGGGACTSFWGQIPSFHRILKGAMTPKI